MRRPALLLAAALLLACVPGRATSAAAAAYRTMPVVVDGPLRYACPLPATAPVGEGWFSDAVMVGDLRTVGLLRYSTLKVGLELSRENLNVGTALTALFPGDGGERTLEQALAGGAWGKVYLMLGINEAAWMGPNTFYANYCGLVDAVREQLPRAQIYVQTIPPVTAGRDARNDPGNGHIAAYNAMLAQLCRDRQVYLVDVAAALAGPEGDLPEALSTDGLSFNREAHHRWIDCLRRHTVQG